MTLKDKTALIIKNHGKAVDYFGLTIYVPKGYKWLAADKEGGIWAYQCKPNNDFSDAAWSCEIGNIVQVATIQQVEGWTRSRVKVKHLTRILA